MENQLFTEKVYGSLFHGMWWKWKRTPNKLPLQTMRSFKTLLFNIHQENDRHFSLPIVKGLGIFMKAPIHSILVTWHTSRYLHMPSAQVGPTFESISPSYPLPLNPNFAIIETVQSPTIDFEGTSPSSQMQASILA